MKLPLGALKSRIKTAGFTMIELLVVIAVIGVLAVAILSSINPIEQINKGRDTRTRSDAAQLISAVERYFAVQEIYPWVGDDYGSGVLANNDAAFYADSSTVADAALNDGEFVDDLADSEEVKTAFINRIGGDQGIHIFKGTGVNSQVYACFTPVSQAFQEDANIDCEADVQPDAEGVYGATEDVFCPGRNDGVTPYAETVGLVCIP